MTVSQGGDSLTDDQLLGLACVECGELGGKMIPIGFGKWGQLFEHDTCAAARTKRIWKVPPVPPLAREDESTPRGRSGGS